MGKGDTFETLSVENNEVQFSGALLPEERANNPGGMQKTIPAAPRGSRPPNAPSNNRACGVGLAPREGACNRNGTLLLPSVGNARNSSESGNVDTIHKK